MKRTNLTIVVIVFVLAAALLPQALFAQGYTVCADESNPQSCIVRHAEERASAQAAPARHAPSGGYGPHYAEQ